jgi:hypothetical protein
MKHVPSFDHFDITPCFYEEAIAHRSIRLGWIPELVVAQDFRDFETRIRRALHLAADITPIRVQNIEVYFSLFYLTWCYTLRYLV